MFWKTSNFCTCSSQNKLLKSRVPWSVQECFWYDIHNKNALHAIHDMLFYNTVSFSTSNVALQRSRSSHYKWVTHSCFTWVGWENACRVFPKNPPWIWLSRNSNPESSYPKFERLRNHDAIIYPCATFLCFELYMIAS